MLDSLEKEIARELDGVITKGKQAATMGDETWTSRIKERLCAMGHGKGFQVSADWCDGADTEQWLFDMVWSEQRDDPERFISIPLVIELEWTPSVDAVLRHFKKLLVVKARQKVLVFQQPTPDKVRNVMTILEDRIRYFHARLPKERYLLAGFAFEQGVYLYESV